MVRGPTYPAYCGPGDARALRPHLLVDPLYLPQRRLREGDPLTQDPRADSLRSWVWPQSPPSRRLQRVWARGSRPKPRSEDQNARAFPSPGVSFSTKAQGPGRFYERKIAPPPPRPLCSLVGREKRPETQKTMRFMCITWNCSGRGPQSSRVFAQPPPGGQEGEKGLRLQPSARLASD